VVSSSLTVADPPAEASGDLEDKLARLLSLGFPKEACEAALLDAQGNVNAAAAKLFEGEASEDSNPPLTEFAYNYIIYTI
jgi:hypothetical protein